MAQQPAGEQERKVDSECVWFIKKNECRTYTKKEPSLE